jgi:hypothetical protein
LGSSSSKLLLLLPFKILKSEFILLDCKVVTWETLKGKIIALTIDPRNILRGLVSLRVSDQSFYPNGAFFHGELLHFFNLKEYGFNTYKGLL